MKNKALLSTLFVSLIISIAHCKFDDEPSLGSDPSNLKANPGQNDALPDAGQHDGAVGGAGGTAGAGGEGGAPPECYEDADCEGEVTECRWPTCVDGECAITKAEPNTPLKFQIGADCAFLVCDGSGNVFAQPLQDPIRDDNECTDDYCKDFQSMHTAKSKGTVCLLPTVSNNSGWCNGDWDNPRCVQCIPNTHPCPVDWSCIDGFCQPPTP